MLNLHWLARTAGSLLQGTNPFPPGLAAQMQDSSSSWFQKKIVGLCVVCFFFPLCSNLCPNTLPPATLRKAGRLGQGVRGEVEFWGKHSTSQSPQEVPHRVCSTLRALGEGQGGEVNIVREGGASLRGQLSHTRGPGQLSPARTQGP